MKTSTVEVGELVSSLSAAGVQRRLAAMPGVHRVDVNYVAGSATVHYDESKVTLDAIRQRIVDCGYHCRGEMIPAHVCSPEGHDPTHGAHATHEAHAGHGAEAGRQMSDTTHDMGHAPGMSMQDMANDMRNRFLVSLLFSIPVFLYSPMGKMIGEFATPFGLDRNLFLFIFATGAIAYPGWPFFVAAWRAARNKVANMATLVVLSVGTGYVFSGRRDLPLRGRGLLRSRRAWSC